MRPRLQDQKLCSHPFWFPLPFAVQMPPCWWLPWAFPIVPFRFNAKLAFGSWWTTSQVYRQSSWITAHSVRSCNSANQVIASKLDYFTGIRTRPFGELMYSTLEQCLSSSQSNWYRFDRKGTNNCYVGSNFLHEGVVFTTALYDA